VNGKFLILSICLCINGSFNCAADSEVLKQENTKEEKTDKLSAIEIKPTNVYVGAYINQILEINFSEDYFVVDFWLWFRWEEPSKPGHFDLSKYNALEEFELVDGIILDKSGDFTDFGKTEKGKYKYQNIRVVGKFTKRFNMNSYPADNHDISIKVEDSEHRTQKIKFVADIEASNYSPNIQLPGWKVQVIQPRVDTVLYKSNFGNSELGSNYISEYNQFIYTINLKKPIFLSVIKTLWPTFLATFVSILALLLQPTASARFDLPIGSIFAIVANKFTITSSVQDAVQFGFSDIVQLLSGGIILITLIESIFAYKALNSNENVKAKIERLDTKTAVCLVGVYLLFVGILAAYYSFK
jgi:hypothetical protein